MLFNFVFKSFPFSKACALVALAALLAACASVTAPNPAPAPATATTPSTAKSQIEYLDLAGFDRELNQSLSAKLPLVNVAVTGNVLATAVPERLQIWLHNLEAGGGTVTVIAPNSNEGSNTRALIFFTIVSGIWNTYKAIMAYQSSELHKSAKAYNAKMVLKINDQGERLIDYIVFTERKPS